MTASDSSTPTAPTRPATWQRVLAVLGPILALFLALFGTAGLSYLILGPDTGATVAPTEAVTYVLIQSTVVAGLATALAAVLARLHGLRLRDLGLRWTGASLARLAMGLGVGAAVVLVVGLPLTWLGLLRAGDTPDLPWWAIIVAGIAQALVLQGFPEELLFRGYQMSALRLRPVAALVISSVTFAALHLVSQGGQQNALEHVLYLALPLGFAFAGGALMIVTDSLWAAVGVHGGLHLGTIAGLFLGQGDGPLLWVVAGAVYTAIGIVLLITAQRRGRLRSLWTGPAR